MPLAALIDPDKQCLEVHYNDSVYLIYARPYTVGEVRQLFSDGFRIKQLVTFPTISSILPECVLMDENESGEWANNEEGQQTLEEIV